MYMHPLADIFSIIEYVRREISEINSHLEKFAGSIDSNVRLEPYENNTVFVKVDAPPFVPDAINFKVRHVLIDLRASLDHLAYACAAETKLNPKNAYFPFRKYKDGLPNKPKGRFSDLPQEIYEKMISFRPYSDKDGSKILYALNDIRNSNLHRYYLQSGSNTSGQEIEITTVPVMNLDPKPIIEVPVIYNNPLYFPSDKSYAIALIDPRSMKLGPIRFKFRFSLDDKSAIAATPIIVALTELVDLVEVITNYVYETAVGLGLFSIPKSNIDTDKSAFFQTSSVFSRR